MAVEIACSVANTAAISTWNSYGPGGGVVAGIIEHVAHVGYARGVPRGEVVERFKRSGLPFPIIKRAFFEELDATLDLPEKVAFAFCDGDLYGSIKTSLKLVVPKLALDGVIVVHDYNNPELPGSARAVDEFLLMHAEFRLTQKYSLAILTR